ncbi:MAG: cell division protein FtsL [Bacilli bacterium]
MKKKNSKRLKLLKGEKFMYFIIILLLCIIPLFNVYTSSLVTKTNLDVEKLKNDIEKQKEENESLEMQIDELASLDNIFNIAKEYGLSYDNSSIIQVK